MGKATIVVEQYTPKEQKYIAVDNLRAMFQCYVNLVRDRALVPPGIGNGLCDYEERFKVEFNKLLDLMGIDKKQVGFQGVEYPKR
ncbi:MAG: hypothetical protein LAO08_06420 [Acidobacteriia bacterium]|nr:hypothetical protein [Terriglobia bacterium]